MIFSVYTDGSCKGNPGKGGWGWVEYSSIKPVIFTDCGGEDMTTNNRMEITAIIEYLKNLLTCESIFIKQNTEYIIIIHSDSQYVLKSLVNGGLEGELHLNGNIKYSGWLEGWKNKNFDKVKNKDLWIIIDKLINKLGSIVIKKKLNIKLKFKYVKGHSTSKGNIFADKLANEGASKVFLI